MTRDDIVAAIAEDIDQPKTVVMSVIKGMEALIEKTVKKGGEVRLHQFGKFSIKSSKARMGRNPSTGEEIKIKASRKVKFSPSSALNERMK